MSVRPSVHPERFPGICRRTQGGNGLKFCTLMYLGHLQNSLDYRLGLLIFLLLASLWLSEMGQIWGFRAFPGEHMVGMAWNFACWCILTTFRRLVYSHGLLIFLILSFFLLIEMGRIWGFPSFLEEPIEGMAWKFACWFILTTFRTYQIRAMVCWFLCYFDLVKWVKFRVSGHFLVNPLRKWPGILLMYHMYLEHLQNWVDYGHSLFIFLILALFWLCDMGQIWGFWSYSVAFPHYGAPLTETGHIWGF